MVKHDKMSGGRSYGKKNPRYCRRLKQALKVATQAAILEGRNNPLRSRYEYLIKEKKYPEFNARHAVCRHLAVLALAVMRSGKKYDPDWKKKCKEA